MITTLFFVVANVAACPVSWTPGPQSISREAVDTTSVNSILAEPESSRVRIRHTRLEWRYTATGWQLVPVNTFSMIRVHRVPPHRPFAIHPLWWTMMLSLLLCGLVAWASDEWDWERIVHQ